MKTEVPSNFSSSCFQREMGAAEKEKSWEGSNESNFANAAEGKLFRVWLLERSRKIQLLSVSPT